MLGIVPGQFGQLCNKTAPSLQLRLSDIYYAKARHRLEVLAGRRPHSSLYGWSHWWVIYSSGIKQRRERPYHTPLFMAHPQVPWIVQATRRYYFTALYLSHQTGIKCHCSILWAQQLAWIQPFSLAIVFTESETESDYVWALLALREMVGEEIASVNPRVVVTDRERALISASQNVFPQIINPILCRWHIGKNVLKAL